MTSNYSRYTSSSKQSNLWNKAKEARHIYLAIWTDAAVISACRLRLTNVLLMTSSILWTDRTLRSSSTRSSRMMHKESKILRLDSLKKNRINTCN